MAYTYNLPSQLAQVKYYSKVVLPTFDMVSEGAVIHMARNDMDTLCGQYVRRFERFPFTVPTRCICKSCLKAFLKKGLPEEYVA